MNLLSNGQTADWQKAILNVLGQTELTEEERETAQAFFDFSKEMDISLLETLRYRKINHDTVHRNSCMLFEEMLRLPKNISMEVTDRYILFWDALTGNTVGRFLLNHSYMYTMQEANIRIHHAYERRYPIEELQPKMLAFAAYGINVEKDFYPVKMLTAAQRSPRDLYRAGKCYCYDSKSFSREKLYSLAIAFRQENTFTQDELDEMAQVIIERESSFPSDAYTGQLEKMVLVLYMSLSAGEAVQKCFRKRMYLRYDLLLLALLDYAPTEYFKKNMAVIADTAEETADITAEKVIKRTVQSAVSSDAFQHPDTWNKTRNSLAFLGYLAQRYTEQYIDCMTANEPLGLGAKWGYLFDCYQELYMILEQAVPDVRERYGLDTQKTLAENALHREVMDVKPSIRRPVMDYLKGDAPVSILSSMRSELAENHKEWSAMAHEVNMLRLLKICGTFYRRYVAYKVIQNPDAIESYINGLLQRNDMTAAMKEMKSLFLAAAQENVPLKDRIKLFTLIYERNNYWEERRNTVADTAVDIMTANAERFDEDYAKECPQEDVVIRCCYARYLDKTNADSKNKDRLLALCADNAKEVRRSVTDIIGRYREYETEVTAMLSAKKQSVRETAVDILALWGADNYRDILQKAADNEKSAKLADKIRAILSTTMANRQNGENIFSPVVFVENIHKGGRARKIAWLFDTAVPAVHFKNGDTADEKYLQAIILCYSTMDVPGRNDNAFLLADALNEQELHRYAAEIFSRWHCAGAESKTKWALYFAVIHGGDSMVETALSCIKEWAENMRGAIAAEAVKAMALNGSSLALMTVDNLAHKFKQKQVKKAAADAMEQAADALGITADELGDRIVPTLGFDENRERIFDYGERKFRVCLSPALTMEVYDDTGKQLKTMPAPGKKDDEALARQSNADYKAIKKQLKTVLDIQKLRLETALLADRRWQAEDWKTLFVKNPIMHSFAIGLIWAAYSDDTVTTFRYMEDGTFNTVDEDELDLPEGCRIGLVHPIDLDEETLSAWKEQLHDYEVVQPLLQLERPVYRIKDEEKGTLDLKRFNGRKINALTLMGRATKLGWSKGSAQDAGMFYVFYREDVTEKVKLSEGGFGLLGTAAELHFSGCYIAVENEEVTLENVRFYTPGTIRHGSYVYDEADNKKAISLDKVPARYFSEMILQLEQISGS